MNNNIHSCAHCKLRAHYDKHPKSLLGRFWHWHTKFCPGWKRYYASLSEDERATLREKYDYKK